MGDISCDIVEKAMKCMWKASVARSVAKMVLPDLCQREAIRETSSLWRRADRNCSKRCRSGCRYVKSSMEHSWSFIWRRLYQHKALNKFISSRNTVQLSVLAWHLALDPHAFRAFLGRGEKRIWANSRISSEAHLQSEHSSSLNRGLKCGYCLIYRSST
jgi:hypothetical protein